MEACSECGAEEDLQACTYGCGEVLCIDCLPEHQRTCGDRDEGAGDAE